MLLSNYSTHVLLNTGRTTNSSNLLKRSTINLTRSHYYELIHYANSYLPEISTEDLLAIGDAYPEDPSQVCSWYYFCPIVIYLYSIRGHHSTQAC